MRVVVSITREYIDLMGWQPNDFGLSPSLCSPELISFCKKEAVKCGMAPDSATGMFPNQVRSLANFDRNVFRYEVTGPAKTEGASDGEY